MTSHTDPLDGTIMQRTRTWRQLSIHSHSLAAANAASDHQMAGKQRLVDLLDVGAAAAAAAGGGAAGHAAGHAAWHATHAAALRVERLHDGRADALDLLLLVLELLLLGELVGLEPREGVVDGLLGL